MRASPVRPQLLKGAIVAIDAKTSRQTTIAFQYNPETLSRTLTPTREKFDDSGKRALALRYSGAPKETFSLDIHLDATDRLECGEATARDLGVYPQLFALEVLVYPPSQEVVENDRLLREGKVEVASGYDAPLTLLVWGPQRVLPVELTSLTIKETVFDTRLNPIQATITLAMRALSYSDLDPAHKGYSLFVAYQKSKEGNAPHGRTGGDTRGTLGIDVSTRLR